MEGQPNCYEDKLMITVLLRIELPEGQEAWDVYATHSSQADAEHSVDRLKAHGVPEEDIRVEVS